MKFTKIEDFKDELVHSIIVLEDNNYDSTMVKDKDLAQFFSEEEIIFTSIRNIDVIFKRIKGRSFSTYLKFLKALAEAIILEHLELENHFNYKEKK